MNNVFELEQDIMKCWDVVADLKELVEDVGNNTMSMDEAFDAMKAYTVMYENRFNRTFRRFEQVVSEIHSLQASVIAPQQDLFAAALNASSKKAKKSKKRATKAKKVVDQ